jgi:hypothetical protein
MRAEPPFQGCDSKVITPLMPGPKEITDCALSRIQTFCQASRKLVLRSANRECSGREAVPCDWGIVRFDGVRSTRDCNVTDAGDFICQFVQGERGEQTEPRSRSFHGDHHPRCGRVVSAIRTQESSRRDALVFAQIKQTIRLVSCDLSVSKLLRAQLVRFLSAIRCLQVDLSERPTRPRSCSRGEESRLHRLRRADG